jgi:hypothetical protein
MDMKKLAPNEDGSCAKMKNKMCWNGCERSELHKGRLMPADDDDEDVFGWDVKTLLGVMPHAER